MVRQALYLSGDSGQGWQRGLLTARIAESVRRRTPIDLAAIAMDTGYSDQAHLSREFARFAGAPPRRWVAEEFRNIQDGGHSLGSHCEHDCSQSDCVDHAASS